MDPASLLSPWLRPTWRRHGSARIMLGPISSMLERPDQQYAHVVTSLRLSRTRPASFPQDVHQRERLQLPGIAREAVHSVGAVRKGGLYQGGFEGPHRGYGKEETVRVPYPAACRLAAWWAGHWLCLHTALRKTQLSVCFHALQGSASINLYVDQDYAAVFLDLRGDISILPDLELPTLEGELGVLLTVGFGSVSVHGLIRLG